MLLDAIRLSCSCSTLWDLSCLSSSLEYSTFISFYFILCKLCLDAFSLCSGCTLSLHPVTQSRYTPLSQTWFFWVHAHVCCDGGAVVDALSTPVLRSASLDDVPHRNTLQHLNFPGISFLSSSALCPFALSPFILLASLSWLEQEFWHSASRPQSMDIKLCWHSLVFTMLHHWASMIHIWLTSLLPWGFKTDSEKEWVCTTIWNWKRGTTEERLSQWKEGIPITWESISFLISFPILLELLRQSPPFC